jgi:hypothetical protein
VTSSETSDIPGFPNGFPPLDYRLAVPLIAFSAKREARLAGDLPVPPTLRQVISHAGPGSSDVQRLRPRLSGDDLDGVWRTSPATLLARFESQVDGVDGPLRARLVDEILAVAARRPRWRALFAGLRPSLSLELLRRLFAGPEPTREDWLTALKPVEYQFLTGWHFKVVSGVCVLLTMLSTAYLFNRLFRFPLPDMLSVISALDANWWGRLSSKSSVLWPVVLAVLLVVGQLAMRPKNAWFLGFDVILVQHERIGFEPIVLVLFGPVMALVVTWAILWDSFRSSIADADNIVQILKSLAVGCWFPGVLVSVSFLIVETLPKTTWSAYVYIPLFWIALISFCLAIWYLGQRRERAAHSPLRGLLSIHSSPSN